MISVENLSVQFGGRDIFRNVSFLVNPKDRIGLVGKNGAGKSTLLKIFMKLQKPDSGTVVVPDKITLGYLPQQMSVTDKRTVYEEAVSAFDEIAKLENEIEKLNHEITHRTDYESKEYMDLIDRLTEKNEYYELLGAGNIEAKTEQTLLGLGFELSDFNRPTKEFSGGWRMRIELAKILLKTPGVILLDEPTNHLDIDSIQWLEEFLMNYPGAIVLISHDRAFLDNVTKRTIEISLGKIYDYKVSYSKYVTLRKERREQQLAAYKNQQKVIEDTKDFIERFRYKATKAVQVQSRIKQLEKIDVIEVEEEDLASLNIKFPPSPRSGTIVYESENLTKSYGTHIVLDNISLNIERGEKVAFVGKNGAGKTTLSRIIMGELDHKGHSKIGHNVKIGYFAQNQDELIDENKTALEIIDEVAVGDIRPKIRDILGAFLFSGDDVDKKVKVLSGGERSRLALAKLLLEPYNLLLLDEPTNHLDMRSKDVLKQALLSYNGTLIVVSHDREFLDGLTNKLYEFSHRKIKEYRGNIYDFLKKKKLDTLKELERKEKTQTSASETAVSVNKNDYLEKKEFDKQIRKVASQVEKVESNIERIEARIEKLNNKMANPDQENAERQEWYTEYETCNRELERELDAWEKLNAQLEQLKIQRN